MQNDNWYYETLGMEMGPASIETLIELARNQTISADDRVKLGVDGKWRRAGSIGRIMAVLPYQAEVRIVNSLTIIGRPAPIIPQSAVSATPPRSITPPAFTPPIAARVPARPRPMTSRGPGPLSQLLESIKTEYRNQAIALVATIGLLGFLFYPRGPVRPVTVHPVKGKIILDGKPLANAAVVLHRVGSSKIPANLHPRAKASADGTFQLETFDPADGAPNGEFVATVFLTEEKEIDGEKQAGPNLLPTVYSQPETSPLKLNITSATSELQPLELTRG